MAYKLGAGAFLGHLLLLLGLLVGPSPCAEARQYENNEYADSLLVLNSRAFKVDIFAPMTGDITMSYEYFFKPKWALVHTVGITAVDTEGFVTFNKGFFARTAIKRQYMKRVVANGVMPPHMLLGDYLMADVGFFAMADPAREVGGQGQQKVSSLTILFMFGTQKVIANRFVLDGRAGLGIATAALDSQVYSYFGAAGGDGISPTLIGHVGLEFGIIPGKRIRQ